MAVFMNSFNLWLWRREVPERLVLLGSILGVVGIGLVFFPELNSVAQLGNRATVTGLALSVLGTWFFSVGNLISSSLSRDTHLPSVIAAAMLIGTIGCSLVALATGQSFALPNNPTYLVALLYLAIGASVVAFVAYLTLVANVGAARAGYATILFPLVALTVSTFFEGYAWSAYSVLGVLLALGGAWLVFSRPSNG